MFFWMAKKRNEGIFLIFRYFDDEDSWKNSRFKTKLRKDISLVTFANSITLTPGTITIRIVDGDFFVYAISKETASNLPGEMEDRIAKIFEEEEDF